MRRVAIAIALLGTAVACCGSSATPTATLGMRAVTGGGLGAHPSGGSAKTPPPFDYNQTIHTGQSLSVGNQGTPALSTFCVLGNLVLGDSSGTYDITLPNAITLVLKSCQSPIRTFGGGGAYPANLMGEIPDNALVDTFTTKALAGGYASMVMVFSNDGQSGQAYSVIKKGGTGNAYAASMYEVDAVHHLATVAGKTHGVLAVFLEHGESDAQNASTTYGANLTQFQSDYQSDIQTKTGQAAVVPLILTQQDGWPVEGISDNFVATAQLTTAIGSSPSQPIVEAGPKYAYPHAGDNLHLTNTSYALVGEKEAEALWTIQQGATWLPFSPTSLGTSSSSITVSDNVVTIPVTVPFPPIVRDAGTHFATAPHQSGRFAAWANGGGFEVYDHIIGHVSSCSGTSPISITNSATLPSYVTTGDTYNLWNILGFQSAPNKATADYIAGQSWTITTTGASTFTLDTSTMPASGTCGLANTNGIIAQVVTISSVAVVGSQFIITTSRALNSDATIGYAQTIDTANYGTNGGGYLGGHGRYGLYHDSDTWAGQHTGTAQPNWLTPFTASLHVPRITSASSVSHTGGTSSVVGSGFVAGCTARIDQGGTSTSVAATCSSSTAASLTIPAEAAGTWNVTIVNPTPNPSDSGTSGAAKLTVT